MYETVQSAIVRPRRIQDLAFGVFGNVTEIHVRMGDFVKEGDALAELDPTDHLELIERSAVSMQIQDIRKQQREIDGSHIEANLVNAKTAYENAERAYNAFRSEANLNARDAALSRFEQAELNSELFRLNGIQFESDYERALRGHEVTVSNLEKCVLTAPADGQILFNASLDIGTWADVRTIMFAFADASEILLHITSRDALNFRAQEQISITIDGVSYQASSYVPIRGDAVWNANMPVAHVFLSLGEAPGLSAGSTVSAEISIEKTGVLVVPRRSVRNFGGLTFVEVLVNEDEIVSVPVETGIISGDLVEVISGLSEEISL